ncbi:HPr family phosphocarrier protein [Deinococcus sp.]|uniref:HPr family phosphocarrier protein n=1 Tax=Deinococcus sp. TaxID=47478 RepID=UPI00345DB229
MLFPPAPRRKPLPTQSPRPTYQERPILEKIFKLTALHGLHARPTSAVVKVAKAFANDVPLSAEDSVSMKNMMQVLSQRDLRSGSRFFLVYLLRKCVRPTPVRNA